MTDGNALGKVRYRAAEWILLFGFVFLVVWPFVPVKFTVWASAYAVVAFLVVAAHRSLPDDSRIKSGLFGRRAPRSPSAPLN